MARDLERLIADLVVFVACAGPQGCSAQDALAAIERVFHENEVAGPKQTSGTSNAKTDTSQSLPVTRLQYTVWGWLTSRDDVHITYPTSKKLATSESRLLNLTSGPTEQSSHSHELPDYHIAEDCHVCISEDTRWESITGHPRDIRRVLPLEWDLLQGIASTRDGGILQADLCRLVNQDKRSVPKRTDSLLKKGYVVKRTTLVHGTKTSRMWLRSFAPAITREDESANLNAANLQLHAQAHGALMTDLEPVPWHEKWTGESVDYAALSTTLMAIIKQWGVIRIKDLKTKLGILGMQWQMKVLARICRVLNRRGAIQYTAARLQERVFKDCIRFARDLTAQDFAVLYAAGKRREQPAESHGDQNDDGSEDEASLKGANAAWLASLPSWILGQPISAYFVEIIKGHGKDGATNTDLCLLSLGPSFGRFVSTLSAAASAESTQPAHLQHLQVTGQHVRDGKVAFYKFFVPASERMSPIDESTTSDLLLHSVPARQQFGFSNDLHYHTSLSCLTEQAAVKYLLSRQGKRSGQLGSNANPSHILDVREPESLRSYHEAAQGLVLVENADRHDCISETLGPAVTLASGSAASKPMVRRSSLSPSHPHLSLPRNSAQPHQMSRVDSICNRGHGNQDSASDTRATFKSRQHLSNDIPGNIDISEPVPELQSTIVEATLSKSDNVSLTIPSGSTEASSLEEFSSRRTNRGIARGRPAGKSRAKCKSRITKAKHGVAVSSPVSKSWVCDKCGGKWKNDIGLKYHLEKSKTSCNPTWNPAEDEVRRARNSTARAYHTRPLAATQVTEETGTREALAIRSVRGHERLTHRDYTEVDELRLDEDKNSASVTTAAIAGRPERGINRSLQIRGSTRQKSRHRTPAGSRSLLSIRSCPSRLAHFTSAGPVLSADGLDRMDSEVGTFHANKNILSGTIDMTGFRSQGQSSVATSEVPNTSISSLIECGAATNKKRSVNMCTRIASIIERCLNYEHGVLPGSESLVHIVRHCWVSSFPDSRLPTEKECRTAMRQMIRKGTVREHWQGFRTPAGNFSNCQIITRPDVDPLCDTCVDMVEKIQAALPDTFVPLSYMGTAETASARPGRRDLPSSVAILDAPVYAAQAAQKRAFDESTSHRYSQPQKKRRSNLKISHEQSSSRLKQRDSVANRHTVEPLESTLQNDTLSPGELQFATASLQPSSLSRDVVEPKAHVCDEESMAKFTSGGRHPQCGQNLARNSQPADLCFSMAAKKRSLHGGSNDGWPHLSLGEIEESRTRLTVTGWMPDPTWYYWVSIARDLARPSFHGHNVPSHSSTYEDLHNRFLQYLKGLERLEISKICDFVNAHPGAAGPHNIFLSLTAPSVTSFEAQRLPKWSLSHLTSLNPAKAGQSLPMEATDVSSEDDLDIDPMLSTAYSAIAGSETKPRAPALGVKRVLLTMRALMPMPKPVDETSSATRVTHDEMEPLRSVVDSVTLTAAIIAVRSLLGGVEMTIDWAFLDNLYPMLGIDFLQDFWSTFTSSEPRRAADMTECLQQNFIKAYERGEVPEINFDNPAACNWTKIIDWTAICCDLTTGNLPLTLKAFNARFKSAHAINRLEDWRNDFFHIQSSVFSRFEWLTAEAASVSSATEEPSTNDATSVTDLVILRSWVRSLCCASPARFGTQDIRDKFRSLKGDTGTDFSWLLRQAIEQLTDERVIRRNQKPALSGRTYQLSDLFDTALEKLAQRDKYQEARKVKERLDAAFRRGEPYTVPYALSDGEAMALTNLNAAKRIIVRPVKLPKIPFGFEPGNYESRKYPKRYYHFKIEALPTTVYLYDGEIDVLKETQSQPPSLGSPRGELPQWLNFAGEFESQRWKDILAACCFALATRGPMSAVELCGALDPILEPFEADLIADWGKKTGVLRELGSSLGVTVGEWWWLAVPWQYYHLP